MRMSHTMAIFFRRKAFIFIFCYFLVVYFLLVLFLRSIYLFYVTFCVDVNRYLHDIMIQSIIILQPPPDRRYILSLCVRFAVIEIELE